MKEITIFGTTKLHISRVLEEPVETPDFGALFQNGDLPFLPDPNPAVQENAEVSCPTYQSVYPYPYQ